MSADIFSKNIDINNLGKPLVISYDNQITEETNRFINTLENHDWDYMIVGKGEKWSGFITRTIKYNAILKTLPAEKIVVLTDARDVYCCRTSGSFIDGFNTFGGKTIVSSELFLMGSMNFIEEDLKKTDFWQGIPLNNYWKYHGITNLPHRKYVNAGLICGQASKLIEQTNWQINFCIQNNITDDQLSLCHFIEEHPDKVILDTDAILLHTSTFGVNAGIQQQHIQKIDSPTFAEFYGRSAFFLHIPGTMNKGQREIYNTCWEIIQRGICSKKILNLYGYNEIKWNEKF